MSEEKNLLEVSHLKQYFPVRKGFHTHVHSVAGFLIARIGVRNGAGRSHFDGTAYAFVAAFHFKRTGHMYRKRAHLRKHALDLVGVHGCEQFRRMCAALFWIEVSAL